MKSLAQNLDFLCALQSFFAVEMNVPIEVGTNEISVDVSL